MSAPLTEHGLIAAYFAPLAATGGFGLLDDAAAFTPSPGCDLVMTVDAIVAGVHFLPDDDPRDIARKALGVNISDLAAKGADPKGFLLTLGLADDWRPDWLSAFTEGLGVAASEWRCPLYGGDTVRANGAPFLSITAYGEVSQGKMVRRYGAVAGDVLCVSGTIGDAALGLKIALGEQPVWARKLTGNGAAFLLNRYRRPQPRLGLAPVMSRYAHAAMDVSDGLIGDLEKLLHASGVSARLNLDKVPLSAEARAALAADEDCLKTIVTGGDDYEILCAIPAADIMDAQRVAVETGDILTIIGSIEPPGTEMRCFWQGRPIHFAQGAFSHF